MADRVLRRGPGFFRRTGDVVKEQREIREGQTVQRGNDAVQCRLERLLSGKE